MTLDLVQRLRSGQVHVDWMDLQVRYGGHELVVSVMRDALRFDNVPAMTWDRKLLDASKVYNGVRLAATAKEMQEIADLLFCMLPTPKILDLVWAEAGRTGTQLESVINLNGNIVAMSNIHDVHDAVEDAIAKAGGDRGGFIEAVGKYWVISNRLLNGRWGVNQAVNYGWFTRKRGNGRSVTNTIDVWQTLGAGHDSHHQDPSQVIRLMHRSARLLRARSHEWEDVDLVDVAKDPNLASLISHEGVLHTTRMVNVPEPQGVLVNGVMTLPEILILG